MKNYNWDANFIRVTKHLSCLFSFAATKRLKEHFLLSRYSLNMSSLDQYTVKICKNEKIRSLIINDSYADLSPFL